MCVYACVCVYIVVRVYVCECVWTLKHHEREKVCMSKTDCNEMLLLCCCCKTVCICNKCRAGQNRICTPYMTVCMVISLLKILYIHRIYVFMYGSGQP